MFEGVAHCCLEEAWMRMRDLRESKSVSRTYRGRFTERPSIPLDHLAELLNCDKGTMSRWFNEPLSWTNLTMMMTALSADWLHLGELPGKVIRRACGIIAVLQFIRARALNKTDEVGELTPVHIRWLERLFQAPRWIFDRRLPNQRSKSLDRAASDLGVTVDWLDRTDRDWGDEYALLVEIYAKTVNEDLWL